MTWTSPSPEWCASGVAGSVYLDGRAASSLVFVVLTVKPIEEQVESNDHSILPDRFWNWQEAPCHHHIPDVEKELIGKLLLSTH